jgi:SAM-dependent methyltransferase
MLNDEVKAIWNANAEYWDSKMGEGNDFHKTLIEPTQLRLLEVKPGQRILDVACGNGQFARKLAGLGALVTGVDFSQKMIAIAKSKPGKNVEYIVADASSRTDLAKLPGEFDAIVCTMAMMDMENIKPLIGQSPKILKKQGAFVFSLLHPCFHSGEHWIGQEQDDLEGRVRDRYFVKVSDYLLESTLTGVAMADQPESQYYFHRPISTVFRSFFEAGFALDGFEEPSFKDIKSTRVFDNVFRNIPPALVCRMRLV